jgi:hypothetical protein
MPRKQTKSAREKAFEDWNHGRTPLGEFGYPQEEISEGSGTLFDVPESNLDDGTSTPRQPEIVDPNAFRITSANIGSIIWVSLLAAAIAIGFVLSVVDSIENPRPDRPYQPPPVNNDPFHPCYGLTAQECKWN